MKKEEKGGDAVGLGRLEKRGGKEGKRKEKRRRRRRNKEKKKRRKRKKEKKGLVGLGLD